MALGSGHAHPQPRRACIFSQCDFAGLDDPAHAGEPAFRLLARAPCPNAPGIALSATECSQDRSRASVRCWLNPAYGGKCVLISKALAEHVWQAGATVVALLPALLHTDWCAFPSLLPRLPMPCCVDLGGIPCIAGGTST